MAFFFTGAGLSADSGVPTFYGANGVYGRFTNPEEIVSADTLKRHPDLLNRFVDDMRVGLVNAEPNEAHRVIARLASKYGQSFVHITQNIDDLVERAGYSGSLHIHGFLTRMRQLNNPKIVEDIGYTRYWDGDQALAPARGFQFRDERTNSRYRPDVVLFGEMAPLYANLHDTLADLRPDDITVVIGTRGVVVPIGFMLANKTCHKVLLNLDTSDALPPEFFHRTILAKAADAISEVEELVREHLGSPMIPDQISDR
jgi:NAD-dependent deacetylase